MGFPSKFIVCIVLHFERKWNISHNQLNTVRPVRLRLCELYTALDFHVTATCLRSSGAAKLHIIYSNVYVCEDQLPPE